MFFDVFLIVEPCNNILTKTAIIHTLFRNLYYIPSIVFFALVKLIIISLKTLLNLFNEHSTITHSF
jgi:hypothetical protein